MRTGRHRKGRKALAGGVQVRAEHTPPLFGAPDPIEDVAPVSPATTAIRSFHRPHPEVEVHCPWCKRPQADCPAADLHDLLDREVRPYPNADLKRPCVAVHPLGVSNVLSAHPGPVVVFREVLFGSVACVEQYVQAWAHPGMALNSGRAR